MRATQPKEAPLRCAVRWSSFALCTLLRCLRARVQCRASAARRIHACVLLSQCLNAVSARVGSVAQVQCGTCKKATWAGCGMHVESVFRAVPFEQRCVCGFTAREIEDGKKNPQLRSSMPKAGGSGCATH